MIGRAGATRAAMLVVAAFPIGIVGCTSEEHVIGRGEPASVQSLGACPEFEPGTNMLEIEWNADPDGQADAATVVQIIGDSAATSQLVTSELFVACSDLAIVRGLAPGSPSIPPTVDETRAACDAAADGVGGLRTAQPELTATIGAISAPCAVQSAITECLANCSDGESCAEFCSSAAPWMADCPGAAVTITFDTEVGPGLAPSWEAVEAATAAVLAARSRLGLANESLGRLAFVPPSSYTLTEGCVPRLIDTITETNEANELSRDTIDGFLEAIAVTEDR